MKILIGFAVVGALLLAWGYTPATAAENNYVGVKTCRKCHKSKKAGKQFDIWKKSKHSKSFETLGTPKAKKAAQKVGVSGNPQENQACLVCHTAGYGADKSRFKKKFVMEDGVQCEACHGPGSEYRKKKVMKKIAEERGPDKKGVSATAKKLGLTFPDEKVCKRCHTQQIKFNGKVFKNPSYKDFDFKERFKKIEHKVPK